MPGLWWSCRHDRDLVIVHWQVVPLSCLLVGVVEGPLSWLVAVTASGAVPAIAGRPRPCLAVPGRP
ncbi:hypothetical protein SAMN05421869_107275 [Nonomuraea jiangxiensis]|uniref:Uncharacterized protein n=1 Tax=Nonomuraea jiangxiensis TaxID=633440 RepID=A0A1G8NYY6_9ACTN|nr:hypothetical protein SAMN05421869_107275 [Nonomuraea jiangxiensis]